MATCSASFSNIGLSGLLSGACAASPASACCKVNCARTGMALRRDWKVGASMRFSGSLRDLPICANNVSIWRTSSSATLKPPTAPAPLAAPATSVPMATLEPLLPECSKAEAACATSHAACCASRGRSVRGHKARRAASTPRTCATSG